MRFDNKKVVITGATGGIGQAVVELFAREGAQVLFSDHSEEDCSEYQGALLKRGLDTSYLAGDLRQKIYCEALIAEAATQLGGVDILINNAGIIPRGTILETTDDMWFNALDVNLTAVFFLSRAAIPHMQRVGGGAIVNTSSTWGIYPGPGHVAYCTSKAAVAALTKNLGRDHAVDRRANFCITVFKLRQIKSCLQRFHFILDFFEVAGADKTLILKIKVALIVALQFA